MNFVGARMLRYGAVLLALTVLAGFAHVTVLREIGSFLVVEDRLRPAAAIVVLSGQSPFREIEAARLFEQGWAPKVILVRTALWEEQKALSTLGIKIPEPWEISREVLLKKGVPPSAIIVAEGRAEGTLEELKVAFDTIGSNAAQVILVSSKYHTRRVRLTWGYVTHGESNAIVRTAKADPFDPAGWWKERRFALSVVREYLGILHAYAGFPIAAREQRSKIRSRRSERQRSEMSKSKGVQMCKLQLLPVESDALTALSHADQAPLIVLAFAPLRKLPAETTSSGQ